MAFWRPSAPLLALTGVNLAISPDARRAATTIRHVDGKSDLWMYDLERGLGGRFTFGDVPALNPQWSPDGREVAFIDGGGTIYAKTADGTGAPRTLISDASTVGLIWDWSPDGSRLLISSQSADLQTDLVLLPAEGDPTLSPFHSTPAEELGGRFSPDGRWLAFLSDESGRSEAYVVAFPGPGGKWQISASGATVVQWLPDGSGLIYETLDGKLLRVPITIQGSNVAIGAVRELFGGRTAEIAGTSWTLAPDGKRILAAVPLAGNAAPALTLVTNWAAEIEQR